MWRWVLFLCAICATLVGHAFADKDAAVAEKTPAAKATSSVESLVAEAKSSVVVITFTGRDGEQQGIGSGFVIEPDGLIATNRHVLSEARLLTVQLADGTKHSVTSIHASDRALDLALIRIDKKGLPALELGDSSQLKQGEAVVALGNPLGLKHSVVGGVVSGVREMDGRQMIQLAIPLEPGNSGGPLLDHDGRVQGILTMKSLVTANLGFAVAINHLKSLVEKPNPIPISQWLTIGQLDRRNWQPLFGADWQQRAGRILVGGRGDGFGGRALCLNRGKLPELPFEIAVVAKLNDEAGAAGLVFHADGKQRHYGFYPSNGRMRLSRFDGPTVFTWNVLEEVESEHYRPGDWNHLKVRLDEDRIRCYVNGQLVIESRDNGLAAGQVGLAKFRDTEAVFKRFRVAREIPTDIPSAETVQSIAKSIEQLATSEDVAAEDLRPLIGEAALSSNMLRKRAAALAREADALRRLAADVHTANIVQQLDKLMRQDEAQISLAKAALLIALLDDDEVEIDGYMKELERMAAEIEISLPKAANQQARRDALDKYLFRQNGFHGSRTDYYHQANSYLNRVIDDREGLPITLSVLYMDLAARLGLKMEGVGLPGHFVVRFIPDKGDAQLIDVFDGGTRMTRADAAQRVLEITGRPLADQNLAATTKTQVVMRMLTNLLGIAQRADDPESLLRYLDAMLAIDAALLQQRGLRAIVRHRTGRRRAALADLDWFLTNKPEGIDLDGIRQMRDQFESR